MTLKSLKNRLAPVNSRQMVQELVRPRVIPSGSDWALQNRVLSVDEADVAGPFNFDSRPYQRGMLNAICDPKIKEVVIMCASQIGKSIVMLSGLAFYLCEINGTRCLYMLPTKEEARKYSRHRISSMLREMPALAAVVTGDFKKGQTLTEKRLKNGGWLIFVASGSSSDLSGMPANLIFIDEFSRCALTAKSADGKTDEGDSFTLLMRRGAEAIRLKVVIVGTPTVKGVCPTYERFKKSDQRHYQMPCPFCGEYNFLGLHNLNWTGMADISAKQIFSDTHFVCRCNNKIYKDHLMQSYSDDSCKWVARAESISVGFQLNRFYSPSTNWSELAEELYEAKRIREETGSIGTERAVINTGFGLPHETKAGEIPKWQELEKHRYTVSGDKLVPNRVKALLCFIDCQGNRFEYVTIGIYKKNFWVVDHGQIYGNDIKDEHDQMYENLTEFFKQTYTREDGRKLKPKTYFIDSGGAYQAPIIRFCQQHKPYLIPTRGDDAMQSAFGTAQAVELNIKGQKVPTGVKRFTLGVSLLKENLYALLNKTILVNEENEKNKGIKGYIEQVPPVQFAPHLTKQFFKQLTAEKAIVQAKGGNKSGIVWKKVYRFNEALDCFVGCLAQRDILGYTRWSDKKWETYEPPQASSSNNFTDLLKAGKGVLKR